MLICTHYADHERDTLTSARNRLSIILYYSSLREMLALRYSVKMKLQRLEEEVTTSHKSQAKNSCQKSANSDNCALPTSSTVRRGYLQTDAFRCKGIPAVQRNLWPIFRRDQVMRALKINVPKSRATRRITSSQPCHISNGCRRAWTTICALLGSASHRPASRLQWSLPMYVGRH